MSMAIAYHMKRKGQPMKCAHGMTDCPECYAKGGNIPGEAGPGQSGHEKGVGVTPWASKFNDDKGRRGVSSAGMETRISKNKSVTPKGRNDSIENAKDTHKNTLKDLKSMSGPTTGKSGFAEGGDVDENDLVDRIIARRMAEGGMVDDEPTADFMSNDFDYLDQEEEDQNDIVSRIMARRKKA